MVRWPNATQARCTCRERVPWSSSALRVLRYQSSRWLSGLRSSSAHTEKRSSTCRSSSVTSYKACQRITSGEAHNCAELLVLPVRAWHDGHEASMALCDVAQIFGNSWITWRTTARINLEPVSANNRVVAE